MSTENSHPENFDLLADQQKFSTASPDLTPMLDTIFLIILLLLATLMKSSIVRGFPVNLPAVSEKTDIHKESNAIEISMKADGLVMIGDKVVSDQQIPAAIQSELDEKPQAKILLRSDASVEYGKVAQLLCRLSTLLSDRQVILVTQQAP